MNPTEKQFEQDIEAYMLSPECGYVKPQGKYDPETALYTDTLIDFVKSTQPREWARFEKQYESDAKRRFCTVFGDAVDEYGLVYVLRHGFKHRGISFKICYFKPESNLNILARQLYERNVFYCVRQWHYSVNNTNSVDMMLAINGIPVIAIELKNQFTGQNIDNSKEQWMYDRDPKEPCFRFNRRILAYFCIDLTDALMSTRLNKEKTVFLPFNQGSNGAGRDGGKGNPANADGYATSYIWEQILTKDSLLDILQKFIHLKVEKEKDGTTKKKLIFPRFHQLDVVRKLIEHTRSINTGHNYLIQHSAGSGKSNSIAWTAYRLASLHDRDDNAIFTSVIIVTDRRVLDKQLRETITEFDHTEGLVEAIDEKKTSQNLKDAINNGVRIIITTLQKFPVIYDEVDRVPGRKFAVIVDEAHSSQTGKSAIKLKTALADTEEALREYAEIEGLAEDEIDRNDKLIQELISHGKHPNLSFYAFTATPTGQTLEMFGERHIDGSFHPFHVYSMRQAIEEGFIMDVLQNYMTYKTCYRIAKTIPDNPEVPASRAAKVIKRFEELHPYNISQKSAIIVETFMETTSKAICGKGKMMIVTSSRLAAVRYFKEIKRYIAQQGYDIDILVAFSDSVRDLDEEYTESKLNTRKDGSSISEDKTKEEFHENFHILVVAEKYQTGFDEPLLHTMVVDKKLRGVKCVQTLSRLNRICEGKNDTFILDFINTAEDVRDAFQPFYQETSLSQEINTDLIYKTQKELRDFGIYSDTDIKKFCDVYFSSSGKSSNYQGKMASALQPVAQRYNEKSKDERYSFRRLLRSFVKWYGYIAQIARMFDSEMHKEFVFCSYLLRLLPSEAVKMLDLESSLKLEYYKLKHTFVGGIALDKTGGAYDPKKGGGRGTPDKKEPLDEIIEKINEMFGSELTSADRVIITYMYDKMVHDNSLRKVAKASDPRIFIESVFPKAFADVAQESYAEQTDAFEVIFKNKGKYLAIMTVLADMIYREFIK